MRVGEELRHVLAQMLARETFHVEEIDNVTLAVTEVSASPDLRNAKAFVSVIGEGDEALAIRALNKHAKQFRHMIAQSVHLKYVPQIHFISDTSFDSGSRVDELLAAEQAKRTKKGLPPLSASEDADSDTETES
ncbi:MAG: 30S ribosome-binding factor RbfA [Alphaproteobacteria bacterium]